MNIELHGPGRAGGAVCLAASRSGHRIVGVFGRNRDAADELADLVGVERGTADLRIIAVSDNAIADVADALTDEEPTPTVHLSGAVPVVALQALADLSIPTGSFHPLQSLPSVEAGADRLPGSFVGVTADRELAKQLAAFASSIGCTPFDVTDAQKPLYHAAATAVANFPLACLALGADLFGAAGISFESSRPLVEAIVANAFELGPEAALTGPIARGDTNTVRRQLEAVSARGDAQRAAFLGFASATAELAGVSDLFREVLE